LQRSTRVACRERTILKGLKNVFKIGAGSAPGPVPVGQVQRKMTFSVDGVLAGADGHKFCT